MTRQATDYHDYVFRDGRLVGEFDAMYQNSKEIPWHQDEQRDWLDVRLTLNLLRDLPRFASIRDYGCGLGYYLAILQDAGIAESARGIGYDVSGTACVKAGSLFPGNVFRELDLTQPDATADERHASSGRELHVIRGTLWYVCPWLASVVKNLRRPMMESDHLLVVQNFPPLDRPFIGKDVLPDHHALVRAFSSAFTLSRHLWLEDGMRDRNDNWFIGLFRPR